MIQHISCILLLALLHSTSSFQGPSFAGVSHVLHNHHHRDGASSSSTNRKNSQRASLLVVHQSSQEDDEESSDPNEKPYFLRRALMADLSTVATILADGFYDDRNPASKWWEKLQTQMSLESNLPSMFQRDTIHHEMWVACQKDNGKVMAFCELDNRPEKEFLNNTRPYMCNLVVATEHRGKGLAQELIRQCEDSSDLWKEDKLFLKVREHNEPAVKLYTKMGYDIVATQIDEKTEDTLLVMKRAWEWKSIVANTDESEEEKSNLEEAEKRENMTSLKQ